MKNQPIGKNSIGKTYKLKDETEWIYWKGDLTDNLSEEEKREGMLVKCSPRHLYLQRKDLSIIRVRKLDVYENPKRQIKVLECKEKEKEEEE